MINHPRTRRWPLPHRVGTKLVERARRAGAGLVPALTAALVLAGLVVAPGAEGVAAAEEVAAAAEVAAADPYAFTSGDVGFSEGGVRDGLVQRLDAMDTYLGDRKPIIRLDLEWWYVQPCRACPPNWDKLRPVVDAAHAKGIRVLLILDYGVPWANGGKGDDGKWFPTEDAAWTGIIDAALAEFGDKIQAYEVWNEPNIVSSGDYGNGTVVERMTRYWQLVQLAHERVHAACPRCVVLAGASANGTAASSAFNENESAAWLDWGFARGYGRFVDAVAHHPYPAWNAGFGPSRPECWTRWWAMFGPPDPKCGELAAVREVMVRHDQGGKQIWGTEFGYPSSGSGIRAIPPELVRDHLEEGVRMWRALDYTGPFFIYSYQDRSRDGWICRENPADAECHFGVTDADGRPKEPIYSGLAAALTDSWQPSLEPGRSLHRRSALRSTDGRFFLWLQGDGNLVLHEQLGDRTEVLWVRGDRRGVRLTNQHDGDLVLYDGAGAPVWASGTAGRGDSTLWMQEDGNLVLHPRAPEPGQPPWASGTVQPPR